MTVRLSQKITARTDELIARLRLRHPATFADDLATARSFAHTLQHDAYLAYLDNKNARNRALSREASCLLRAALAAIPVERARRQSRATGR